MQRAGDVREGSEQEVNLASILFDQGDIEAAKVHCLKGIAAFAAISDKWAMSHSLALYGSICVAEDPKFAAFIWGAAERLREEIGVPLQKVARAALEKSLTLARERLSASELDAEWNRGREAGFESVIVAVLAV